jgi:hypothetical protein
MQSMPTCLASVQKDFSTLMAKKEQQLGWAAGGTGIYASLTATHMATLLQRMPHLSSKELDINFWDLGAGIGRPQVQALWQCGVSYSVGWELDKVRADQAKDFIERVGKDLELDVTNVKVQHGDIAELSSLYPCTHLYLFWCGWSDTDKGKVAALVRATQSVYCVCIVDRGGQLHQQQLVAQGWPPMQRVSEQEGIKVKAQGSPNALYAHIFVVAGRVPLVA